MLFSETSQPPSLAIDDLKRSDDGVYKCRVDFRLAQTSITRVYLTVIGTFFGFNHHNTIIFPLFSQIYLRIDYYLHFI